MDSKKTRALLVTGSSGLIGSEARMYFDNLGWEVHGIDNNMQADFFGPDGDITWNLNRLKAQCKKFTHHNIDIRDWGAVINFCSSVSCDFNIHAAVQPSHDLRTV